MVREYVCVGEEEGERVCSAFLHLFLFFYDVHKIWPTSKI